MCIFTTQGSNQISGHYAVGCYGQIAAQLTAFPLANQQIVLAALPRTRLSFRDHYNRKTYVIEDRHSEAISDQLGFSCPQCGAH